MLHRLQRKKNGVDPGRATCRDLICGRRIPMKERITELKQKSETNELQDALIMHLKHQEEIK